MKLIVIGIILFLSACVDNDVPSRRTSAMSPCQIRLRQEARWVTMKPVDRKIYMRI